MTKTCTKCGETKQLDAFGVNQTARDGRKPQCKTCRNTSEVSRWHRLPTSERSRKRRDRHFRNRYRLPVEEYDRMLESQQGCCAICGASQPQQYDRFHVDHDHKTGRVRALLCTICNLGLGAFKDSPERLASAIAYLERYK